MDEQEVAARRAFGARFEEEMARLGTNPDALAPRVGMNRGTLFNYKKGDRVPDAVGLLALHQAGGMDLRFLVTGHRDRGGAPASYRLPADLQGVEVSLQVAEAHGAQWRDTSPRPASTTNSDRGLSSPASQGKTAAGLGALLPVTRGAELRPVVLGLTLAGSGRTMEYEVIPRVCGGALAGSAKRPPHAAEELVFDRVGEFAMSRDWLARNLNHTSGDLASVHVIGDSMAPTLLDGDVVVIDRGVREVTVDAIYLVSVSGRRLVKRLQRKVDGSVVIISDNPSYERETIAAHRVEQIEVLGRMVWPRVR